MSLRIPTLAAALASPAAAAALLAAAAAGASLAPTAASAGPVGQLFCNVSAGTGFVITSSKGLNCEYSPAGGGPRQHYVGTINSFGLHLGTQGPGQLTWDVASVGGAVGPGALAGSFKGASASASVGAGIGTNALFGGLNGGLTLQPLSVQTETGVNVAAGVSDMTLEYAP